MARIGRLQDTVTSMKADITVNFGAVQHAERRQDNLREEVATLTNLVFGMERQIQHLQSDVRDLRGKK
jgi:predicted  nucleic acid-binding Zn-ribbon protein